MRIPAFCALKRLRAWPRLILSRVMPMRQIFSATVLSGLLIVLPPAFGQRGSYGGGHGAGFTGHSAGGGFVSHFSGPAFSGPGRMPGFPTHSFGPAPRMELGPVPSARFESPIRPFDSGSAYRAEHGNGWGGRGDRDHDGRYRAPYRGYGYGYGAYPYYANSWALLPWDLGYSDFAGDSEDYDDSGNYTAQQPQNEVATPTDQGYGPAYPSEDGSYRPEYGPQPYPDYAPPPPASSSDAAIAPEPPLTLFFKDGHQESIENFVLTPQTVIVMKASGRQQRIPLADLNLPATEQAAQQAGLDFNPPA